jgi:hypothetical protein
VPWKQGVLGLAEALLLRESAMRIALLLLLAGLAGWAFWPIADARYAIVFDPEATRAAKDFVAAPAAARRSDAPERGGDRRRRPRQARRVRVLAASLPTPNIERIAREGVTVHRGLRDVTVCSPSRAALLTGRQQQRFGFELLTHDRYPHDPLPGVVRAQTSSLPRLDRARRRARAAPEGRRAAGPAARRDHARGGTEEARLRHRRSSASGTSASASRCSRTHRGFDYQYGFYEAFSLYAIPTTRTWRACATTSSPTATSGGPAAAGTPQSAATAP